MSGMRKIVLLTLCTICIITTIRVYKYKQYIQELNEYKSYVISASKFIKVDVPNLQSKIDNGEDLLLYTGRITCPYCRKLVPQLATLISNHQLYPYLNDEKVYYLDSENTDWDSELKNFRNKYGIDTVPSVIYFKDNRYNKINLNISENNTYSKKDLQIEIENILKSSNS